MSDPTGSDAQPVIAPVVDPGSAALPPAPDPSSAPPPTPVSPPPPPPGAGALPPPPPRMVTPTPETAWRAPAGGRSRLLAAAFALLLGGFGIHKFYLGRPGLGILYLVLCWTGIPAFIGWLEGISYLATSDESWAARFGGPVERTSRAGLGCLWLVALGPLLAMLAAIGLIILGIQVSSILSTTGAPLSPPVPIVESPAQTAAAPDPSMASPSPRPSATPAPSVDQAALEPLLTSLRTNPSDTVTLLAVGDVYYRGAAYGLASGYYERALAVEPDNVDARLALGATQFNLGDLVEAERSWLRVVTLSPDNLEAHYDLGFVYVSQAPPDLARARAEWEKVVAADPSSELGRLAQQGLDELAAASQQP